MGGKGGGSSAPIVQPDVKPSPYEESLANISNQLYSQTGPLRTTFLKSWQDFLNPTPTLRPGATPQAMIPQYSSTPGTAATPQMYQDPLTGTLYGGDAVQGGPSNYYVGLSNEPGTSLTNVIPYGTPGGGTDASKQITGYTPQYAASDYITEKFNPANLPGYTPMYDISRRGIEAQYNTALQNAISTTPRGGSMSDALNRLNLGRAESVGQLPGQISSGLIQDMMNKAYGAVWNAPSQSISGLSAANQGYTSTQNALLNAQMQQAAINQSASNSKGTGLGSLGAGLGTVVGSAFGSPWLGGVLGGIGGGGGSSLLNWAGSTPVTSDKRTKKNIRALDIVNELNPVLFDYKHQYGQPGQMGFIADEIEKIAPGMVVTGEDGLKRITPYAFIPLLINAIKEQQAIIDELRGRS